MSFGRDAHADVRVAADYCDKEGHSIITLVIKGQEQTIDLPYFHEVYALNVAAVLAIGLSLELNLVCRLLLEKKNLGIKGRFHVHRLGGFTLVDDAYNANPQSMKAGLDTIRKAFPDKRKILILGDMRELGTETEQAHRDIGAYCAMELKPELLVTVGESSQWIHEAAVKNGLTLDHLKHYAKVEDVLNDLDSIKTLGDLLYVKASNGLNLAKIIDKLLAT